MNIKHLKQIANKILPFPIHNWLENQLRGNEYCPPVGAVHFGNLRRLKPVSRQFGYDRGLPLTATISKIFWLVTRLMCRDECWKLEMQLIHVDLAPSALLKATYSM
ncbi:MAG: hypothetical protein KME29_30335 [Calothrix sp. FI2-JRJ7]|nr:hypothetical protein [Calothrix sp. FI2-JRJ7]